MAVASGEADTRGGYIRGTFETSNRCSLATYTWLPPCGTAKATGSVFLMHSLFGHARFEFLEPDEDNRRVIYADSFVEGLNKLGFIVFSHDHPSHGESTSIAGYEPGFFELNDLRDGALEYFEETLQNAEFRLSGKRNYVAGMSMGGTIAIEICRIKPSLFSGVVLFSPAVRPPDDSFGPYGRFLRFVSGALDIVAPKWRAISIPPSPVPQVREAVEKDDLVYKGGLSVRVGIEFLRVYGEINDTADTIEFPSLLVISGEADIIVSPSGIDGFVSRVVSPDKISRILPAPMGHEVLREPGRDECFRQVFEWLEKRTLESIQ